MAAKAFILIETQVGRARPVLNAIKASPEVKAADLVTGTFDIIATVEAADIRSIADVVTGQIQAARGVTRTITCVVA